MKAIENNFDDKKVNELLKKHFIELRSVSPVGSTHVLDIEGLKNKTIKFWSIWDNENLIGCGAIKTLNKYDGEFKSIRVHDEFREKALFIEIEKIKYPAEILRKPLKGTDFKNI